MYKKLKISTQEDLNEDIEEYNQEFDESFKDLKHDFDKIYENINTNVTKIGSFNTEILDIYEVKSPSSTDVSPIESEDCAYASCDISPHSSSLCDELSTKSNKSLSKSKRKYNEMFKDNLTATTKKLIRSKVYVPRYSFVNTVIPPMIFVKPQSHIKPIIHSTALKGIDKFYAKLLNEVNNEVLENIKKISKDKLEENIELYEEPVEFCNLTICSETSSSQYKVKFLHGYDEYQNKYMELKCNCGLKFGRPERKTCKHIKFVNNLLFTNYYDDVLEQEKILKKSVQYTDSSIDSLIIDINDINLKDEVSKPKKVKKYTIGKINIKERQIINFIPFNNKYTVCIEQSNNNIYFTCDCLECSDSRKSCKHIRNILKMLSITHFLKFLSFDP